MLLQDQALKIRERWDSFFNEVRRPEKCHFCEHPRVLWNGTRLRSASVLTPDGVVHVPEVRCRRVKCQHCRRSWTLRPDGLVASRHYQLCVVAAATERYMADGSAAAEVVAAAFTASRRTLGRWLGWVAALAPVTILQHLLQRASQQAAPIESLPVSPSRHRAGVLPGPLALAAEVLSLIEALAMAIGLEPPGLRAIVEAVTARGATTSYRSPTIPELARRLEEAYPTKLLE